MRDPLQRIVSHYFHNVRNLFLEAERRDFARAVSEDPEYLAFSDYAMQLEPYFRLFGRERVACLVYEDLVADPRQVTAAVVRWLGLDGAVPDARLGERWNGRPTVVRQASGLGLLNRLAHSAAWARIAPAVPGPFKRMASRLASREVDQSAAVTEAMLDPFRPRTAALAQAVSELLGRAFPQWTSAGRAGSFRGISPATPTASSA